MNTITLKLKNDVWMATFTDAEVIELFGSDTLPTAYTGHTPADQVLALISALNPSAHVVVAH